MARLTIVESGRKRIYDICEDVVRIGSSSDNNIEVAKASKNHCEIRKTPRGFKLIDLESKLGTAVNGDFINQHVLEQEDKIKVADVVLVFDGGPSVEVKPSKSTSAKGRRPRAAGTRAAGTRLPASRATGTRAPIAPTTATKKPVRLTTGDDDDERPRYRREPEGLPSWALGLIVGGAAVVILLIVFGIINSSGSDDPGVTLIRQAQALFEDKDYEAALQKLEQVATTPGVPDWAVSESERLSEECQTHIDAQINFRLFQEAKEDMNEVVRFVNNYPIEIREINRKLDAVEAKYSGNPSLLSRLQKQIDGIRERYPLKAN